VLRLSAPVTGIRPAVINTLGPVGDGVAGKIVGFGTTAGLPPPDLSGIRRSGNVVTSASACQHPNHVCWHFNQSSSSNTCGGDSGGPLFVSTTAGDEFLAGVTSFGSASCLPPDIAHDADVFLDRAWIASQAGSDLATGPVQCGSLQSAGTPGNPILGATNPVVTAIQYEPVAVSTGVARLRIGTTATGSVETRVQGPAGSQVCFGEGDVANYCEIVNPLSGGYVVSVLNGDVLPIVAQTTWALLSGSTTGGPCVPSETTLCLNQGRFRVEATFQTPGQAPGTAKVVKLTDETGYFWFFSAVNVEAVVKVLNACVPPFNRFWVLAGGLTNVQVVLTVTDTQPGAQKTYTNPQGKAFQPIQDTNAFETCP
jgi:hypothetical protein